MSALVPERDPATLGFNIWFGPVAKVSRLTLTGCGNEARTSGIHDPYPITSQGRYDFGALNTVLQPSRIRRAPVEQSRWFRCAGGQNLTAARQNRCDRGVHKDIVELLLSSNKMPRYSVPRVCVTFDTSAWNSSWRNDERAAGERDISNEAASPREVGGGARSAEFSNSWRFEQGILQRNSKAL